MTTTPTIRFLLLSSLLTWSSCSSAPAPLPEGEGKGVVAFDPTPPAGAELFERPTWRVGDHFTLLRGGRQKLEQKVVVADENGYELEDPSGGRLLRDLDLATLGERPQADAPMSHAFAPRDARYLWPLWVGKQWKCQFVDKNAEVAMPFEVSYLVEGIDTIEVPAGRFRCLRLRRTSARATEDGADYYMGTMVIWYSPELGLEVRQVISGLAIDLIEWAKAPVAGR